MHRSIRFRVLIFTDYSRVNGLRGVGALAIVMIALSAIFSATFVYAQKSNEKIEDKNLITPDLPQTPDAELARLLAPDPTLGSKFGTSVAIDGNYLIVGDPSERNALDQSVGAAYIFFYDGTNWIFQTKLNYPGNTLNTQFGQGVAISGDTIAVGDRGETANSVSSQGCVYVYTRNGTNWTLQQQLLAANSSNGAQLGSSVAIDHDTIVAGAYNDKVNGVPFGSAYVFARTGGIWAQEAKLTDVDGNLPFQSGYGWSVSINQDTAVVGVRAGAVDSFNFAPGFAIVYRRSGTAWTREARLLASDGANGDEFGYDVAIEGDTAVVGARSNAITPVTRSGAAYIFSRNGSNWTQQQKLSTPFSHDQPGFFGGSVGISGNRVLIGARAAVPDGLTSHGAAFEFVFINDSWVFNNRLRLQSSTLDDLGIDVAIQGNRFVCGATFYADPPGNNVGAAYFFIESPQIPDLRASSDSGSSNTDNITNISSLTFDVGGISPGATVDFLRDGSVIASRLVNQDTTSFNDTVAPNATYRYSSRQTVNGEVSSTSDYLSVTVDTIGPSITIDQDAGTPDPVYAELGINSYSFRMVPSELFSGLDSSDISFSGSTANVSNATVTISQNPIPNFVTVSNVVSNGQFLRVSIPAGAFTDLAGNLSFASTSVDNTVTIDNVRPTVTINQALSQPDPVATGPINFTAVFSEPVTGFSPNSLTFVGSTANLSGINVNITGSGTTYNVAVSNISSDGQSVRVSIIGYPEFGARDLFGNRNIPSTSTDNTVTLDNVRPSVTVNQAAGQSDPTRLLPINYKATFSEPVAGFESSDISFAGSTLDTSASTITITGTGPSYDISIGNLTSDGGILKVSILSGAVSDPFGNVSFPSTSTDNSVRLDNVPPTVTINQATIQADPTTSLPINYTVIFSESVSGFNASDISLSGSTAEVSSANIGVTGSGPTYNVSVTNVRSSGIIRASVVAAAAADITGNQSLASTSIDNSVTFHLVATVDGRVVTSDGRGLRNATVSITNSQGVVRTATTSSFGFFSFDNVAIGDTYTVRISSRLYRFSPQTLQVNGNLTLADFVGQE